MTSTAWFVLALLSWTVACLSAIGAKVLIDFSMHELEQYCQRRQRRDFFNRVMEVHDLIVQGPETLTVLATLLYVASFVAAWDVHQLFTSSGIAWLTGGIVLLLAGLIWIPDAAVEHWSAPILYHSWRIWNVTHLVLWPLHACGLVFEGLFRRLAGRHAETSDDEEAFEEEIRSMVTAGLHDGLLEADAREMIEGVIELGDYDVGDIMTPRSQIDAIPIDMEWSKMLDFVIEVGRTRIPVYREKLDDIVGVLYAKDLLAEMAREPERRKPLHELLRETWSVPATKRVDELLREFQRTRNHLAIVVDEYRSVAGVVTIEDALEEIVGEIVDEYDEDEEREIQPLGAHTAEALGHAHISDINEQLGLNLPDEDDFDTIAGLVISRLGHIPKSGEKCEVDHAVITVLEASRRQILRVRIEMQPEPTAGSAADAG